jgi:hypothetical protein
VTEVQEGGVGIGSGDEGEVPGGLLVELALGQDEGKMKVAWVRMELKVRPRSD